MFGMQAVIDDDQTLRIRMCGMGVERADCLFQKVRADQAVWVNRLGLGEVRQAEEG